MSQNQYFRAGVGCVIYNNRSEVLVFRRADDTTIWQFPQGGFDVGEETEETLWRELFEETTLRQADFTEVTLYPEWLFYEYPDNVRKKIKDPNCFGQTHRWFFLRIESEINLDLSKTIDKEFDEYKWLSFPELLEITTPFKKTVYEKLQNYFNQSLLK